MAERTRTVSWADPVESARAGTTLSGLEYMRAIAEGKFPAAPIALLMGFAVEEVEQGVFIRFIHRPLSRYVNSLLDHGFELLRMVEPAPIFTYTSPVGPTGVVTPVEVSMVRSMKSGGSNPIPYRTSFSSKAMPLG